MIKKRFFLTQNDQILKNMGRNIFVVRARKLFEKNPKVKKLHGRPHWIVLRRSLHFNEI